MAAAEMEHGGPRSAVVTAVSKKGGKLLLADTGAELPFDLSLSSQLHKGQLLYAWLDEHGTVSRISTPANSHVFRGSADHPTRLTVVVKRLFVLSIKSAKEACKQGRVRLNEQQAEDSRWVQHGDTITLLPSESPAESQMQVIFKQGDVAVLCKPAGELLDFAAVQQVLGEGAFPLCRGVPKTMAALVAVGVSEAATEALKAPGGCRGLYLVVCDGQLTSMQGLDWVNHSRSRKGSEGWISTAAIWCDDPGELLQQLCVVGHPVLGDANPQCRAVGKEHIGRVKGKGKKLMAARIKLQLSVEGQTVTCEMEAPPKLAAFTVREAKAWEDFQNNKQEDKLFCGYVFETNANTMKPKGSTEPLVHAVVKLDPAVVCELGLGCGSILISILLQLPAARGVGVELDPLAVECARANIIKHGLVDRCEVVCADFGQLHQREWAEQFDVIVSNPPYHDQNDKRVSHLLEGLASEPPGAVFVPDGQDRATCYTAISQSLLLCDPPLLVSGGHVVLEVGAGMVEEVEQVMEGLRIQERIKDNRKTVRCLVMATRT